MSARPSRDPFSAPTTAVRQGTTKQSPPPPVDAPSVEQLLKQAEACPLEAVRMLAQQIRAAIGQLRTKLDEVAAFTATQRELLDAEARVAELRAKLAQFGHADEPQPPAAPVPTAMTTPVNGKDIRYSHAVRDWARARGLQVASNGRIADSIIDAYLTAHR